MPQPLSALTITSQLSELKNQKMPELAPATTTEPPPSVGVPGVGFVRQAVVIWKRPWRQSAPIVLDPQLAIAGKTPTVRPAPTAVPLWTPNVSFGEALSAQRATRPGWGVVIGT